MPVWIVLSCAAALFQTVRFVLQKKLAQSQLSAQGATFARFVYSAPVIFFVIVIYLRATGQPLPNVAAGFGLYALIGGIAQIVATICVVRLFAQRNFAVGITFKKTEVLQAILVGIVVLGEGVSGLGLLAICVGLFGVFLLSDPPGEQGGGWWRLFNPAAGLGLLSGVLFAVSGVCYRGASLAIETGDPVVRAGLTLVCVTTLQTVIMTVWLAWRERGQIRAVLQAWRVAGLVGVFSLAGSFCWFTAFTLQNVAYVKAVGQVELAFSYLASRYVFGERGGKRENWGIVLVLLSVVILAVSG